MSGAQKFQGARDFGFPYSIPVPYWICGWSLEFYNSIKGQSTCTKNLKMVLLQKNLYLIKKYVDKTKIDRKYIGI